MKRFSIMFFIVIGIAVFLTSLYALLLFLMPGIRIFGLKYIAVGTHTIDFDAEIAGYLSENGYGTFNENIEIYSSEIPVKVCFTQNQGSYIVKYYDDYNGLTTSGIEDPTISVKTNNSGNTVIKINEFKKFLYENSNSKRYVILYVPIAKVQDPNKSLKIDAGKADVSFYYDKDDTRDVYYNSISIKTNGKVYYPEDNKIYATNFSLETKNTIKISDKEIGNVNATNYSLKSTGGKIVISRNISGDLEAETNDGDIRFVKCKNLKATSVFGDIYGYEDEKTEVEETANVTTFSGDITLNRILGASQSVLKSDAGSITIDSAKNVKAYTNRGLINVVTSEILNAETKVGKIVVNEITNRAQAISKWGKIFLGTETMKVKNIIVETVFGDISAKNVYGDSSLKTDSGNINFSNDENQAKMTTINCGGKLVAENLFGDVDITSNDDTVLRFLEYNGKVKIKLKENCKTANIYLINESYESFNANEKYYLTGSSITFYKSNGTGSYTKPTQGNSKVVGKISNIDENSNYFKIESNADIELYFN